MSVYEKDARAQLSCALVDHSVEKGHVFAVYCSGSVDFNNFYLVPSFEQALRLSAHLKVRAQKKYPDMKECHEIYEDHVLSSMNLVDSTDDKKYLKIRLQRIHNVDDGEDKSLPYAYIVTQPWGNMTVMEDPLSLDLFIASEALETKTFRDDMKLSGHDYEDVTSAMCAAGQMKLGLGSFKMTINDIDHMVYATSCPSRLKYQIPL